MDAAGKDYVLEMDARVFYVVKALEMVILEGLHHHGQLAALLVREVFYTCRSYLLLHVDCRRSDGSRGFFVVGKGFSRGGHANLRLDPNRQKYLS